jgi:Spx/MgsR family transcriptional regulator
MELYGIKACDTCRAALKTLAAAGHEVRFVDVRESPLTRAELEAFEAAFGAALLNTRSTTWRGLSAAERAGEPVDLMLAHPTLMKRPVIRDDDGTLHLGWGKAVQAALS